MQRYPIKKLQFIRSEGGEGGGFCKPIGNQGNEPVDKTDPLMVLILDGYSEQAAHV